MTEINLQDIPVEEMYSGTHFGAVRTKTDLIVIHATRGGNAARKVEQEANDTAVYMSNDGIPEAQRVSSHYVVGDQKVFRVVHEDFVAWHATYLNPKSLGIEVAQTMPSTPFMPTQLDFTARIVARLCAKYSIPAQRIMNENLRGIMGHEDTAQGKSFGKTDPGTLWDWNQFMALVAAHKVEIVPVSNTWPNGRVVATSAEYDAKVWTPLMTAYTALANGGDGSLGDDQDAAVILAIKKKNEQRHGINR